jgi:hypothetical protein
MGVSELQSPEFFCSPQFAARVIGAIKKALLTFVWVADGGGAG